MRREIGLMNNSDNSSRRGGGDGRRNRWLRSTGWVNPRFEVGVRLPILLVSLAIAWIGLMLTSGCTPVKPEIIYKTVYTDVTTPVIKCEVPMPVMAAPTGLLAVDVENVVTYAKELEIAYNKCRGE